MFVARSGEAPAPQQVPIELHSGKLLAWLVDRHRSPSDWRQHVHVRSVSSSPSSSSNAASGTSGLLNAALSTVPALLESIEAAEPQAMVSSLEDFESEKKALLAALELAQLRSGNNAHLLGPDVPEPPSSVKITPEPLHYFNVIKPVCDLLPRILPATEGARIPIVGGFSSPRMRAWDALRRSYEQSGIHVAQAADVLESWVKFDYPQTKKAGESAASQLRDMARRRTEMRRAAKEHRRSFVRALAAHGVDLASVTGGKKFAVDSSDDNGESDDAPAIGLADVGNVSTALREAATAALPEVMEELMTYLQNDSVTHAIAHYGAFIEYTTSRRAETTADETERTTTWALERLPTLSRMRREGANLEEHPTSEFDPFTIPSTVVESTSSTRTAAAPESDIDWSALAEASASGNEPDFSISTTDATDNEIDWSALMTTTDSAAILGLGGEPLDPQLDLENNLSLAADAEGDIARTAENPIEWDIEIDDAGLESSINFSSANSPLEDAELRAALLSNLRELFGFCRQRQMELQQRRGISTARGGRGGSNLLETMLADAAPAVPAGSSLESMVEPLQKSIDLLESARLLKLLSTKHSPQFVERTQRELNRSLEAAERCQEYIRSSEAREVALRETLTRVPPVLEYLKIRIRSLKGSMERAISDMYEGRPIRIIGEVNAVLRE